MEEQEGKNLARRWLTNSEVEFTDAQFDEALWTAANAIIDLVPFSERHVISPREYAELPKLPDDHEALDEVLIMAGESFFRITGWRNEEGLEVSIRRLKIKGFGTPTISEMRVQVNGAEVRKRGWTFPHLNGSSLFIATDRTMNGSCPEDHPERFAEELAKIAGWDVTEQESSAASLI